MYFPEQSSKTEPRVTEKILPQDCLVWDQHADLPSQEGEVTVRAPADR